MAYPDLPLLDSSTIDLDAGIETSRASNGKLRSRRMFPAEKATINLKHWLTGAQVTALKAHYADNKDLAFGFVWPLTGVSRSCSYAKAPTDPRPAAQPGMFLVDVQLLEV